MCDFSIRGMEYAQIAIELIAIHGGQGPRKLKFRAYERDMVWCGLPMDLTSRNPQEVMPQARLIFRLRHLQSQLRFSLFLILD